METLWFVLVAFMLTMYVVLDGFDIGAGILHLFIARNDKERRTVLNAIGPFWDGNEVWLIAAGGTLYFAFPHLYASAFSGFYLPLILVLWLLMFRALGIELRHQFHHPMWTAVWDVSFGVASILLAVFFGAALGNVLRGVPLNAEGYFYEPLWTTFTVGEYNGILDWFTISFGILALCALTVHGASYLAHKTSGALQERARAVVGKGWWLLILLSAALVVSLSLLRPNFWGNFALYPVGWILPILALLAVVGGVYHNKQGRDTLAFLSSSFFIITTLGTTAFALYPNVLSASTNPEWSLTIYNTSAQSYGLSVGLLWWILGIVLVVAYFVYVYRAFRGKVELSENDHGY